MQITAVKVSLEKTIQPKTETGQSKFEPLRTYIEITADSDGIDIQKDIEALFKECETGVKNEITKVTKDA
jgi:hypothetical protein